MNFNFFNKVTFFVLFLSFGLISCTNDENDISQNEVSADLENVDKLISGFNQAYKAKRSNKDVSDEFLNNVFLEEINSNGLDYTFLTTGTKSTLESYSDEFTSFALDISETTSFQSKENYVIFISNLEDEILNSNIVTKEKQILINKIAVMVAFTDWLEGIVETEKSESGFEMKSDDDECDGWWSCWGKCTAAVLGGTGTGALAGAVVPAAGCTLVLPGIGTVACGAVGAIVGGVSGALTAAGTADAC